MDIKMTYNRSFLHVHFTGQISICPTRVITASSGRITSPNYPRNYSSNTDCTLTIRQPLDTRFTFTFTEIDLEGDGKCYCVCKCDPILYLKFKLSNQKTVFLSRDGVLFPGSSIRNLCIYLRKIYSIHKISHVAMTNRESH
jgi:hypothetical protein